MRVTREDLAWATGFIEGEGCFQSSKGYPGLDVSQAGVDGVPEVLLRLKDTLQVGVVRGPYGPYNNPNRKPIYRYQATGDDVRFIRDLLSPWLGTVKRSQANRMLAAWEESRGQQGRRWAERTHCQNGHEFTPNNTRIVGRNTRRCLTCQAFWNEQRGTK